MGGYGGEVAKVGYLKVNDPVRYHPYIVVLNFCTFAHATNRVIASVLTGEESPDSKGQCTGQEPGGAQAFTDSATENNCPAAASAVAG